jgi:N-acetylglucosamine-6-phosphate deacetylase
MEGTPEAICAVSRTLAAHGTTSYLATSVVCRGEGANRHLEVAAEGCEESGYGAQILGIHLEGPYVNPARGGLIRSDRIWPPDREDLGRLLKITRGFLRMMTLAPELPGALDLLPVLKEAGAVGSLGHTEASFKQARAGLSRGIRHVTHLYNAMRGLHHREPGALGAVLMDHAVTAQLIADGVHVHPELLRWTAQLFSPEALVLITDALPSAGLPDGTYSYDGRPYESRSGSAWHHGDQWDQLFGTTLLLDEMVRRAVRFMGVTFPSAVVMATLNPARTLGLESQIGSLVPSRQADLVLWGEDLQVLETWIRGKRCQAP